jgi:hypothetical protein
MALETTARRRVDGAMATIEYGETGSRSRGVLGAFLFGILLGSLGCQKTIVGRQPVSGGADATPSTKGQRTEEQTVSTVAHPTRDLDCAIREKAFEDKLQKLGSCKRDSDCCVPRFGCAAANVNDDVEEIRLERRRLRRDCRILVPVCTLDVACRDGKCRFFRLPARDEDPVSFAPPPHWCPRGPAESFPTLAAAPPGVVLLTDPATDPRFRVQIPRDSRVAGQLSYLKICVSVTGTVAIATTLKGVDISLDAELEEKIESTWRFGPPLRDGGTTAFCTPHWYRWL